MKILNQSKLTVRVKCEEHDVFCFEPGEELEIPDELAKEVMANNPDSLVKKAKKAKVAPKAKTGTIAKIVKKVTGEGKK